MVTKDTNILVAVQNYPFISEVFKKYGLGCVGCMIASGETLGEGISAHGLDAEAIIAEINKIIAERK